MSAVVYINEQFILVNNYLLSESIKPQSINYGANENFNNSKFEVFGNVICTSFLHNSRIYTVTFFKDAKNLGFHYIDKRDIDFNNFNYLETIIKMIDYDTANPSNAAKVFNYVFYITLEIIKKFNLREIRFDGANSKLDKFYDVLVQNSKFIKEFEDRGFIHSKNDKFHIFKS